MVKCVNAREQLGVGWFAHAVAVFNLYDGLDPDYGVNHIDSNARGLLRSEVDSELVVC